MTSFEYQNTVFQCKLKKYGRKSVKEWNTIMQDQNKPIFFIINNCHHLIIIFDEIIQENFSLLDCSANTHATLIENCILFVRDYQNQEYEFRVEIDGCGNSSSIEIARIAVSKLMHYIPIKIIELSDNEDKRQSICPIDGIQDLSTMAKVMCQKNEYCLPSAYQRLNLLPTSNLDEMIHICLMDSSFIQFVELVEKKLDALTKC